MLSRERKFRNISIFVLSVLLFSSVIASTSFGATLKSVEVYPSTDIVNSYSYYTVSFKTATTSTLSSVQIAFPSGTNVVNAVLESVKNLPAGSITTSTAGVITYTLKSPASVSAGKVITFNFYDIQNPPSATSAVLMLTVSTFNGATLVDSGTGSYVIRELTGNDISTSSSLTIAALSTGTLTVSGAATFLNTVSTDGTLYAVGGINTASISSMGTLSVDAAASFTGLLTASGGISVPTGEAVSLAGTTTLTLGGLLTANGGLSTTTISATSLNGITIPAGGGTLISTANIASNSVTSLAATGPGLTVSGSKGSLSVQMSSAPTGFTSIGVGSLSLNGGTLSAQGTNINLFLASSDGTKLEVGLGNAPLTLFDHFGNELFSIDGLGVVYTKQIDVTSSEYIYLQGGGLCVVPSPATGSLACGGNIELYADGELQAANGGFQVGNTGSIYSTGTLATAGGNFEVNAAGQITTPSVGFGSFSRNALPSLDIVCSCTSETTGAFSPAEDAVALVFVKLVVSNPSLVNQPVSVGLSTTFSGATISGPSASTWLVIPGTDQTLTTYFEVYAISAGNQGQFTVKVTAVGLPSGSVTDLELTYVMIPAE